MGKRLSFTDLPDVITVTEAARLLGLSRGVAYEGFRTGKLPCARVGRRMLVFKKALEAWLEEQSRCATGDSKTA